MTRALRATESEHNQVSRERQKGWTCNAVSDDGLRVEPKTLASDLRNRVTVNY